MVALDRVALGEGEAVERAAVGGLYFYAALAVGGVDVEGEVGAGGDGVSDQFSGLGSGGEAGEAVGADGGEADLAGVALVESVFSLAASSVAAAVIGGLTAVVDAHLVLDGYGGGVAEGDAAEVPGAGGADGDEG